MIARVLVAEDEEILRTNLCDYLSRAGYAADGAADGQEALERVLATDYAVLLADIRMPRLDGISLLKRVVAERPETAVLITTAYATVDSAVESLRYGAFDYLLKPVVFEDLLQKLGNLVSFRQMKEEVLRLRREISRRLGFEGIVGDSEAVKQVLALVDRVAPTPSTVLVTGETGTGKELVARAIHAKSAQNAREFLAVNLSAIPADLVEAQLFGHERGAFTGATKSREGVLRAAHGGTVFLDEVGELPSAAQAKLLRAIEGHEVTPVGADRPSRVEFRLIAATNHALEEAVATGRFRGDLFYRLNVFRIAVPPLRERREDIPALVKHFVRRHAEATGRFDHAVTNPAMRMLVSYPWPGNVRELSNVIERAGILAGDAAIDVGHLPAEFRSSSAAPIHLREAVQEFERQHITAVLRAARGNKEETARLLGVDPATLYRRIAKYELE
ncbi:MAG: sigma-54-dependent Fis family transcriptional regulator [Deltaproteobacteria bacterium]|nr:sigma-54-dependent Fis family transcriptional regulator [Deltaproteobacteria bacterium]